MRSLKMWSKVWCAVLICLFVFAVDPVRADSPLTSTDFAKAYANEVMVNMAADPKADIPMLLNYLADKKAPVDMRLAVVNQMGWSLGGQSTGDKLSRLLQGLYQCGSEAELAEKLDAGTLAVYAYAKAMSNYFDVSEAGKLAHQAAEKNKQTDKSFSVAMAAALIDAQTFMTDGNWGKVYPVVAQVINDASLHQDMRKEAVDIIMEYINLYKEDAN